MGKRLYILILVSGIALILWSCIGKKEIVFRMPVLNLPISYTATIIGDGFTNMVTKNIYDTLIIQDNSKIIGCLAENWYSPNEGIITLKLKDNLLFSDGTPLTTEDVKKSFEKMLQHPLFPLRNTTFIDSIILQDDNIIDIYYQRRTDEILGLMQSIGIMKTEYLERDEEYINNSDFATSGVYYIFSKNAEKIILKKNTHHRNYQENKDAPDIVELLLQPDLERQYQKLKDDIVDFVQYLPIDKYSEVFTNSKYRIIEKESNIVVYMMLNATGPASNALKLHSSESSDPTPLQKENPLKNKKVRQALAHAIDIKSFIKNTLYSEANCLVVPALRNVEGYPTDRECYEYNLELSKLLLEEAGVPDGFELNIQAVEGKYSKPLADFVKESLKNINIDVNIDLVELRSLTAFDPDQAASIHALIFNQNSIESGLKTRFFFNPKDPYRFNRFHNFNPRINELIDILEATDEYDESRPKLQKELTDIIYDETFVIPFINPFDLFLLSKKFTYKESNDFRFTDFKVTRRRR